jgi:hypothetical protein
MDAEIKDAEEWLDSLQPVSTSPTDIPWEQMTPAQRQTHLLVRGGYRLETVARMYGRDSKQYAEILDTWSGIIRNEANVRAEF